MGLINNNIKIKLNNWCFNCWVSIGNKAGWIKSTKNILRNYYLKNSSTISCNLLVKHPIESPPKQKRSIPMPAFKRKKLSMETSTNNKQNKNKKRKQ